MPRCGQCGKVNREGALYCQDCGTRIIAEPELPATRLATPIERVPTPRPGNSAASGGVGMMACPACGVGNPAGMSFCKMCGARLEAAAANAAAPAVAMPPAGSGSVRTVCPACGRETPAHYSFCQYCGGRLGNSAS